MKEQNSHAGYSWLCSAMKKATGNSGGFFFTAKTKQKA
jgi:hypothetical protein